jgi:hypothetical protein
MQETNTQLLKEIINLLYYILQKMPHPTALLPQPVVAKKNWLDSQDVMQQLHISPRTLQRWRNEGRLSFSKVRGKIWYLESDIHQLLMKGR